MDNIIQAIRHDRGRMWIFSLFMGVLFKYVYGISKVLMWSWDVSVIANWFNDYNISVFTVVFNAFVDFTASLPAAALIAYILVRILINKEVMYGTGTIIVFLLLASRLRKFFEYPERALQISAFLGPIIAASVLLSCILFFVRLKKKNQMTALQTVDSSST